MMGREVRKVAPGWEHPKNGDGDWIPLYDGSPWSPLRQPAMPRWTEEQASLFCYYETVTEGTPLSPPFATLEELGRWCYEAEELDEVSTDGDGALVPMTIERWVKYLRDNVVGVRPWDRRRWTGSPPTEPEDESVAAAWQLGIDIALNVPDQCQTLGLRPVDGALSLLTALGVYWGVYGQGDGEETFRSLSDGSSKAAFLEAFQFGRDVREPVEGEDESLEREST